MLINQIDQDLKEAQKEKNEVRVSSLRNLKAAFKNFEIEKQHALSDEEALSVIAKKVKQHKDSISEFEKGNRTDLVKNEQMQMEVLMSYLPKQMDESQVRNLVTAAIKDLNAKPSDFGKVMKEVLAKAGGQTDGSVVSRILKEELK